MPLATSALSSGEYGQTVRASYQGQTSTLSPISNLPKSNKALLKENVRRRQAEKIEHENMVMLKRLQDQKPTYNVQKWLQSDE